MKILLTVLLFLPVIAQAGLLDLLPLNKIERKMIYPLSPEYLHPTIAGLPNTVEHRLENDSGTLLVWSVPAKGTTRATVLYFQGNAGNLAARAPRFKVMQAQGLNVLAMSYRGSSGSSGVPSETAITRDAVNLFQDAHKYSDVDAPQKLILYGESLGSAVAIALLAELPKTLRPAGIILEAPFTSTPDMARALTEVPASLIARISDRWESLERAKTALTLPLLVIRGTADEVTPISMGRAIFKTAPVNDKNFIAVKGASHSGTWRRDTTPRLWRFMRTYGQD